MPTSILVVLLLGLMSASDALAMAKKKPKPKKGSTTEASDAMTSKTKKKPAAVEDGPSDAPPNDNGDTAEAARASRKIGGGLLITPLSDFVLKYGATGFYTLSPKIQLSFNILTGNEDLASKIGETEGASFEKAEATGLAVFGAARYFFGNSFNAAAGLGLRSIDLQYRISEKKAANVYLEGSMSATSIALYLAIGNHWQWGNGFFVGCDWLAAMVPITSSSKSETSGSLTSATLEELNNVAAETASRLSKATSLHLLVTQVGYAF